MAAPTTKHINKSSEQKDLVAFDNIYQQYCQELFSGAYKCVHSTEKAEEVIQNLFVKIWGKRDQSQMKKSVAAYLFRTLKFRILNYLRHEKVRELHLQFTRGETVAKQCLMSFLGFKTCTSYGFKLPIRVFNQYLITF